MEDVAVQKRNSGSKELGQERKCVVHKGIKEKGQKKKKLEMAEKRNSAEFSWVGIIDSASQAAGNVCKKWWRIQVFTGTINVGTNSA